MTKSEFEVADIFRAGLSEYCQKYERLSGKPYQNYCLMCETVIDGWNVLVYALLLL